MRLKTESETGERFLRHALPISLLILRKKPTVLQSMNALNISVQERKCNLQSTVFSEEKYASKSGLLIKSLRLGISELRNYCTKI